MDNQAYMYCMSDDDDELVAAAEAVEIDQSFDDDDELVAAAETVEIDQSFETALQNLNESVEANDIVLSAYYEEMGEILAMLDPNNPIQITADPIPGLRVEDVLYGCNDDVQYGGGTAPLYSDPLFSVQRKSERFYKKFQTQGVYYSLKITTPDPKINPEKWLLDLLNAVIDYFKNDSSLEISPGDRIGMSLSNNACGTDPIYISLRRADQLEASVVLEHVMRVFDSNKEFFLNGHLTIQFDHVQLPHGGARVHRALGETTIDFIRKKTCFIKYNLSGAKKIAADEYCLPYAIVVGRAYLQYRQGEITYAQYRKYQTGFKLLRGTAVGLCLEADVNMSVLKGGCSFDEVRKFQAILPNYQLVIYMGIDMKKTPYADPKFQNQERKINIMFHENHYTAMRSVAACFAVPYVCPDCHTSAHLITDHKCKYGCPFCEAKPKCNPINDAEMITCVECHRDFMGATCYLNHLLPKGTGKLSVCDTKKKCPICKVGYKKNKAHYCNIFFCKTCEDDVPVMHQCHMPKYETKRRDGQNNLYVLYDFETQQDTPLTECEPNKFRHVPNLCVVQTACGTCSNDDITIDCKDCGVREFIYDSTSCVASLMDYIALKSNAKVSRMIDGKKRKAYKFNKIIAIAHNMSGFDGQFILKYIYEPKPNIILNGTKVIMISLGGRVNFIDSLNYFHAPLPKLPQLFGFEGSKGFFPHLHNTKALENFRGVLPAKHFYCPETMSVKGRAEFDEWYDAHTPDYIFDNKKEIIKYCRQDVTILRKACVKFANDFWECNKIDPFLDACTIAGACNRVFRSNFLEKDSIGIIPGRGYRFSDNQSQIAIKWLCGVEEDLDIQIQHAGRGPEVRIGGVGLVDGRYEDTVFEFDGCLFHACITCYPNQLPGDTSERSNELRLRREKTVAKHRAIREAGYNLIVMRECDFRRQLKANPELDSRLQNHPMVATEPLKPRDAFFGGRTNANILYCKADKDTKIHYFDICSLYPYVNKVSKAPINHATVHVGDDCLKLPWQHMDGLMKVTVLPPRKLDFPVLPTRMHSKLMFVLCNTCAQSLSKEPCNHNEIDRQFTGTWVIDEVKLAISKGYQVVKIHEIWECKVTQYDPKTQKGGLFSGYINRFLKIKAEASGVPKSCRTPEQLDAYRNEFYEREGIRLDKDKIKYNPSLRQLAKIQLNSFWGRFGMRPDLLRTVLIRCHDELVLKMFDSNIEVQSILPINDNNMLLVYREIEETRVADKTTNVVIAAFTTAYARMELYKYLELLGTDRVLYYDTDSIIFTSRPGQVMPEKGNFLGQMTDELEGYGVGSYIIEFVSGGPKNYAYKVYSPTKNEIHTVVKVKGITLNYENSQVLNFDVIKNMVIGPEKKADDQIKMYGIGSDDRRKYTYDVKNPKDEIQAAVEVKDQKIESIKLNNNSIRRTNLDDVYTTRVPKTYRFNYTKRQMIERDENDHPSYGTVPYGY